MLRAFSRLPAGPPGKETACVATFSPARGILPVIKNTRRIVILSNAAMPYGAHRWIRPGDLVIHLNRAKHADACRQAAVQNVRHWLFVRRSSSEVDWFVPASMKGFDFVHFIGSGDKMTQTRWHAEWRLVSKLSPTTGFIAANTLREIFPGIPMVLIGFAPGRNIGTYRWHGHDWQAEKTWYETRGFHLIPPASRPALNQIWIGSRLPQTEARFTNTLRRIFTASGWQHFLWREEELFSAYADDPASLLLRRIFELAPCRQTCGVISDYYRMKLLSNADPGGFLYLDTDFSVNTAALTEHVKSKCAIPEGTPDHTPPAPLFPAAPYLWGMDFINDPRVPQNGFFYLPPGTDARAAIETALETMRCRLFDLYGKVCTLNAEKIAAVHSQYRVPHIIGPFFLNSAVLPAMKENGLPFRTLPAEICTHSDHKDKPGALVHNAHMRWRGSSVRITNKPLLHLLIPSCQKQGYAELRQACRDTWISHLPDGMTYLFLVGGQRPQGNTEEDTLFIPDAGDTYALILDKVIAGMREALQNRDFDWLGKVDDDTYFRGDRMIPYLLNPGSVLIGRLRYIPGSSRPSHFPGGAGYFMRRDVAQHVLNSLETRHLTSVPEDFFVTRAAIDLGYKPTNNPLLAQSPLDGEPKPDNLFISGHKYTTPVYMHNIHRPFACTEPTKTLSSVSYNEDRFHIHERHNSVFPGVHVHAQ